MTLWIESLSLWLGKSPSCKQYTMVLRTINNLVTLPSTITFQGDTRGFALMGSYEVSKYPTRRFGMD